MKTIVIFSGAGLSRESGIPTFRDAKDGLWEKHKVEDVASQDGWRTNKSLVLDFYAARMNNILSCEPNAAHYAIASLQEKYNVINITQNIDDLLERAGCKWVWHLHGSIMRRKCEWYYDISNLDGDTQFICDYKTFHEKPVELGERCPKCQGQLRPDVVWFGEAVDMRDQYLMELSDVADTFIGIGTSAQVHPAAGLLHQFNSCKGKYFLDINPPLRLQTWQLRKGPAGEQMPLLAKQLLESTDETQYGESSIVDCASN